jgi:hypothetical protein
MNGDELLAHDEIRRVLFLSCRGLDRRDRTLLERVYHPEARHTHGDLWEGLGHEYAQRVAASEQPSAGLTGQHHITNVLIQIDGASAAAESYYLSMHAEREAQSEARNFIVVGGRFLDRFEKRAGEWKIFHRRVLLDWSLCIPSPLAWALDGRFAHGAATTQDPSAEFFRGSLSL